MLLIIIFKAIDWSNHFFYKKNIMCVYHPYIDNIHKSVNACQLNEIKCKLIYIQLYTIDLHF